jgi:hypothetical protein
MGASPEEMGGGTLRPLRDSRTRALVGEVKTFCESEMALHGVDAEVLPKMP